jgi:hypothetical protein
MSHNPVQIQSLDDCTGCGDLGVFVGGPGRAGYLCKVNQEIVRVKKTSRIKRVDQGVCPNNYYKTTNTTTNGTTAES